MLCDEFISESAPKQVNIPSECRIETLKCLADASRLTPSAFDDARHECYQLMSRDTMPRFMATGAFGDLLTFFGSYDVSNDTRDENLELFIEPMAC